MMDTMDKDITIGAVVAALPEAAGIFREFGIDYCCGGNRKLYDVILSQDNHLRGGCFLAKLR